MLGKWWKKIILIITIIACIIDVSIKIVNRPSSQYFQDIKSDASNKFNEIRGNLKNKK